MALTPSTFILSLGSLAPAFSLPEPKSGETYSLEQLKGEAGTLVVFACNHCPYVVHLAKQLGEFAERIAKLGVSTVVISSNDVENYPQDGPEEMVRFAESSGWSFPYLYDEDQSVARDYAAACTPDFFLFDAQQKLYYAGQFDDTRPNDTEVPTGVDLHRAVTQMLDGSAYADLMKPATGCNIKWKSGQQPDYVR